MMEDRLSFTFTLLNIAKLKPCGPSGNKRRFCKTEKTIIFVISVCLSVFSHSATAVWILMKFDMIFSKRFREIQA
jgi:hypothetical protein